MAVTLKDIARETGLSVATVSKYMNGAALREKNRAAIERAVKKLDYTVNEYARGLKSNKSRTIGVVIPELSNLFVTQIITRMEEILRGRGYSAVICDCHTDPKLECEAVRFLMGKMVDGVINMPVNRDGRHLTPALKKGLPIVLIDRAIPELNDRLDSVLVDNAGAARKATLELLEKGHREIGIIVGPPDIYTSGQRLKGYEGALREYGLAVQAQRIAHSDYTLQGGYESMCALLDGAPSMTALFVTNYEMTLGALIAANERNVKIPDDLSFIGFDNMDLSRITHPPLTIVAQPLEQLGTQAANIMLNRLTEPSRGTSLSVCLTTSLQGGQSVRTL